MKSQEARRLIATDPDYIYLKRFDFSLEQLIERHPGGVPDRVIAAALMITEEGVGDLYNLIIAKLREAMKVE